MWAVLPIISWQKRHKQAICGIEAFCTALINVGGIIDVYHQRAGSEQGVMREHVERIETNLQEILYCSDRAGRSPHLIAEELAEECLLKVAEKDPLHLATF